MKILITAESPCDLPVEYIKENNVKTIPLAITFDNNQYLDGVDITVPQIFERVKNGASLPKTAARSVEDYVEFFKEQLKSCDKVLHVSLSSELSCSFQNANLASKELENVYVIDSKNLSSGIGLVIMTAVELLKTEQNIDKIIEELNNIVPKVKSSFVVNTMSYLSKGGRCSSLASFAATILKIKPSLVVKEGKITVGKKYMGRLNESVSKYIDDVLKQFPNARKDKIFITYSSCELIDIKKIEEKLLSYGFKKIYQSFASSTISSHCGPNCVGILFIDE